MTKKTIPALDLMFFLTESPESPKHVGAVQIFQLPANAPKTYLRDLVAEFKKAPVAAPFSYTPHFPRFGMPEWREDNELEINYHVRHSALPKPGSTDQLMEVVQRLHGGLLDRHRPVWFCQIIEGLEHNRFAVYSKVHHACIDGMSGVKRMYGSLSTSPRDKAVVPPWSVDPDKPSKPAGSRQRSRRNSASGQKLASQLKGAVQAYELLAKTGLQLLKLRDSKAQIPFAASRTRMNRPIDWDTRSTAVCTFKLDRVKAIGAKRGCTVNEVVLTVIGAALHDYLKQHRENTRAPLVALCPMSIRSKGDNTASTQVSAVHVRLGAPDASICDRLEQVIESSHASKDEVSNVTSEALIDYGVFIFALWELLSRSKLDRFIAPSYNVLVSNVPGPGDDGLYLRGSRMIASYPISTLLPGVNLNTTLLSHGNSLDFGLLGDMHALPDLDIVVQRMQYHFAELEREVLGKRRASAATRKKSAKPKAKRKTVAPRRASLKPVNS